MALRLANARPTAYAALGLVDRELADGLRLAFMGTPDFAVPTLAELIAQGHDIAAVYSQPPRPKGRGMALEPRPSINLRRKPACRCAIRSR